MFEYRRGIDLQHLMWRMRLKQVSALESYLQEVAGSSFLAELPLSARHRISLISSLFDHFLSVIAARGARSTAKSVYGPFKDQRGLLPAPARS